MRLHYILPAFALTARTVLASPECKCVPGDPCWPSDSEFASLNDTVSGQLIRGVPPGSVCYPSEPNYNETACAYVRANWHVSTFHAQNPISIGWPQWAGNPCPPIFPNGTSVNGDPDAGERGCTLGGYPAYALNATVPEHIEAVVKFARKNNIRLNVKSTGHSFQGRSTAFASISIWTHNLQGIQYHENFQPDSCSRNASQMAFAIAAGARSRNVYEAANKQNAIVVAGSAQDVGIVGWFTGGGHGPLSSTYGMGTDNVLQATIVTPEGEIVTANECLHPDLFWAIRGGGGGTFGIVTEVVMKAYPAPTVQSQEFLIMPADPDNLTDWWDAVTYFWSDLPRMKAGGLSGYFFVAPPITSGYFGFGIDTWSLLGRFSVFDAPNGTADSLMEPLIEYLTNHSSTVNHTFIPSSYSTFFESWNETIGFEAVAVGGGVLGSRFLTEQSLTSDIEHLHSVLQNVSITGYGLQGLFIANSANRNDVSLNPAWRDAVVHAIVIGGFLDSATLQEQRQVFDRVTNNLTPKLKSLAPDSGAYFNEADPNDPNWQYDFFGENYERLRSVKRRYDPDDVLWCRSCVGSERWVPENLYSGFDGDGRLCQAPWVGNSTTNAKGEL